MKVFKFGGASVKDAQAVINVAEIIQQFPDENIVVVVSAMGKTTNLMEALLDAYVLGDDLEKAKLFKQLYDYHYTISMELGLTEDAFFMSLFENKFAKLEEDLKEEYSEYYDYEYDRLVGFGELMSTTIVSGFLNHIQLENWWIDARKIIRTDSSYRNAKVNWEKTKELCFRKIATVFDEQYKLVITQGFIGHNQTKQTTTLGREGSDFTAGILAWCLDADEVIIWKDVPGMLNADPKYFNNCVKLDQISFKEAIELSYYGASVIHPKTIKPLQNKEIPLYVKSFIEPKDQGTKIHASSQNDDKTASFIFKENQMLLSFIPKDFSFIDETSLYILFGYFSEKKIKVNLMQNSAISFTICIDYNLKIQKEITEHFKDEFYVRYNDNLELLTIRHFNQKVIDFLTSDKEVLVEQKSRQTARFVMRS